MASGSEIIVDLSDNDDDDDDCVLESITYKSGNQLNNNGSFDDIFKENPILAEIIEKCFNLESSEGMLRVIKRTLVRVYKEADSTFKSSSVFQTILKKTLINLDKDPCHKFSHIRDLCEILKSSKIKKRMKLITLEKKIRKKSLRTLSLKRKSRLERKCKKQKTDVIDLDKYEDTPMINLDQNDTIEDCSIVIDDEKENSSSQENSDCIEINSDELTEHEENSQNDDCLMEINNDVQLNGQNKNISKTNTNKHKENVGFIDCELPVHVNSQTNTSNENSRNTNSRAQNTENTLLNIDYEKQSHKAKESGDCSPENNLLLQSKECHTVAKSPEKLLIPQKESDLTVVDPPPKIVDVQKIKNIESEIAKYKQWIVKLDEEEVTDDTTNSPYVRSEKYKEKIVQLYKELCTLTGTQTTKRREVRLTVIEGHPPGPVRRLERFLNRNIGEDGNPPFPDFSDVVKCVESANVNDNLGWNKHQVMREAIALFTHCGRALQKRRQRREWSDLLSRVRTDECERDPADGDPQLLARLEANRRVAVKKEADLLERYSVMQNLPPKPANATNVGPIRLNQDTDEVASNKSVRSPQVNNIAPTKAPTKENKTNLLDRIKLVSSSDSHPKESKSNSEFDRNKHINLVQNTSFAMPQIIAESITNKTFTDEFGLKVNNTKEISNVKVNFANNIAVNSRSHVREIDFEGNVIATRLYFESNVEDESNMESNVGEVNTKCNDAANETNVSRLAFESNDEDNNLKSNAVEEYKSNVKVNYESNIVGVSSTDVIVKMDVDEVNINECDIAAVKTKVPRLIFESNDEDINLKSNALKEYKSNVKVNCESNGKEINLTEVIVKKEVDEVNINECDIAAVKTNVPRLTFESNYEDSNLKSNGLVLVDNESNVEVNPVSNVGKVKFESNSEEVISSKVFFKTESEVTTDIKTEPTENIARLLNDIGNYYTVSIFDVEDPFLVVEISDSSDEED